MLWDVWTYQIYFQGSPRADQLNEVVCQTRYSKIVPSTFGTVIYRVLPPNINVHSATFDPYSKEIQDLLKITNIRIVMTELHSLGDETLLDTSRNDVKVSMICNFRRQNSLLKSFSKIWLWSPNHTTPLISLSQQLVLWISKDSIDINSSALIAKSESA